MENELKVYKHIQRICYKYLSVYKLSPNTRKIFKQIQRMRGKNLCLHREDVKRLLTYSPTAPRDIKLSVSQFIMVQWNFFETLTFYAIWVGLSWKTISRYCPFTGRQVSCQSTPLTADWVLQSWPAIVRSSLKVLLLMMSTLHVSDLQATCRLHLEPFCSVRWQLFYIRRILLHPLGSTFFIGMCSLSFSNEVTGPSCSHVPFIW
jgi:hypothetical protein